MFSTGGALSCLQLLLFLGPATNKSCALRAWAFSICFVTAFGSLFIKTWRVWVIFKHSPQKRIRLTDKGTMSMLLTLIVVEVGILLTGQILTPQTAEVVENEFQFGRFYETIECRRESREFALLDTAFQLFLVVSGCYLSISIRNVDVAFSESKQIMFAIYQVAVYGLLAYMVNATDIAMDTRLFVASFCCVFAAVCCILCVLAPKFVLIKSGTHDKFLDQVRRGDVDGSGNNSSGKNTSYNSSEEIISSVARLSLSGSLDGNAAVHPEKVSFFRIIHSSPLREESAKEQKL